MVRFPEAQARMFKNKFACKSCKKAIRTSMMKIMSGKISCPRCGSRAIRPLRKK